MKSIICAVNQTFFYVYLMCLIRYVKIINADLLQRRLSIISRRTLTLICTTKISNKKLSFGTKDLKVDWDRMLQ